MSTRSAALTAYIALIALFMTATVLSQPEAPTLSMSSMSLEKTNRVLQGSPDSFVMERFAG
ncbi:hypothetical protein LRX75_16265 [Rhizobium sp. DKSPLA3]|uniref:Uncharacterized protein n=1 Tax=Rhizobium quercicola TaxID=2901226 RepID=A0A9X1T200_9HYPH|nr:hypothetical protein [Rhizobium quercicola]MCD7110589.1 hypothetical protein [Rhizobium quercicola]